MTDAGRSTRSAAPAAPGADRPAAAVDAEALRDVREGLSRAQKQLPPKYFYDRRGSELFEEITGLPEYYLTRAERELLLAHMGEWAAEARPSSVIELGAGSAAKTRIVLDAAMAAGDFELYVPVDISADFLEETARTLRGEYPRLRVRPVAGDIGCELQLPADLPRPALFALLGSTIGNFAPESATALLGRIAESMERRDRLLLGVDLRKDPDVIEAAYNDPGGLTAEFNRNALRVVNRLAGTDFDPDAWEHRAFYDDRLHRIEMHLIATRDQVVTAPTGERWPLQAGETIRTEISCKHDRDSVEAMLEGAGLRLAKWETDGERYAIALARR